MIKKDHIFFLFEKGLWRVRYIVLFPIIFLIIALIYLVFLMGDRVREATKTLLAGHDPFETLIFLIDIVDFTLIAVIILLIIWGVYEIFIRDMAVDIHNKVKADHVLIHDIDELKQKLGKVVIVSLVVHAFKQALYMHVADPADLVLLAIVVILLAIALYLSDKMGGKNTNHCCDHTHVKEDDDKDGSSPGKLLEKI